MSLTLMVFFSAGISVLAETIEQKDVDVTAQYIQTAEGFNQAPVKNGEGSLTTEEGVKVSVSGAPGNARYLVVCPILKNTDGGRWLIKCLNGRGDFICAYDIYFLDEAGNRINAKGVTVTIDSPADTDNLEFYSVSTDGTVTDYSVKDNCITFKISGNRYYVFTEKTASDISVTQTPTAGSTGTSSQSKCNFVPKTADNTNILGLVIALVISAATALLLGKKIKLR